MADQTKAKHESAQSKAETKKRHEHELEVGAGAAVAGAAIGAIAGPPGAAVGAIIGAIAGAITGATMDEEMVSADAEDLKLDKEIGVSGGEMGAPNLKHPPAKIGAYSGGSVGAGASTGDETPAEGPMQEPE